MFLVTSSTWPHIQYINADKKKVKYINFHKAFLLNFSPGTLILSELLLPAPRPCGSCLCWSGRSDWKSLSGEFNTAAQRCLSCGLRAIPFIFQLRALRPSGREEEARREGGKEGGLRKKKKKEKEKPASPGLVWRGWIPQENSCDKEAQTSNSCIKPLNGKDTGARKKNVSVWACETRNALCSYCSLCVRALKDRAVVSRDEVMCATCSIMSSTEFGHGLAKAEPGYPFSVLSESSALLQSTSLERLKGPKWLNEQSWSTCLWTVLKIERSLFVQTAHRHTHMHARTQHMHTHTLSEGQGVLLSFL